MNNNPTSDLFDFESLELYKKSLDYIDFVYKIISHFPKEERFGLASQLSNAANSISLNIGEGYGESISLALRYLRITRGSIRECLVNSTISVRNGFIPVMSIMNRDVFLLNFQGYQQGTEII